MYLVYRTPHAEEGRDIQLGHGWKVVAGHCSSGEPWEQGSPVRKVSRNNYKFAIESGNGTKQGRNNRLRGSIINSINAECILIAGLMHFADPQSLSVVRTIENGSDVVLAPSRYFANAKFHGNFIFHHRVTLERESTN